MTTGSENVVCHMKIHNVSWWHTFIICSCILFKQGVRLNFCVNIPIARNYCINIHTADLTYQICCFCQDTQWELKVPIVRNLDEKELRGKNASIYREVEGHKEVEAVLQKHLHVSIDSVVPIATICTNRTTLEFR